MAKSLCFVTLSLHFPTTSIFPSYSWLSIFSLVNLLSYPPICPTSTDRAAPAEARGLSVSLVHVRHALQQRTNAFQGNAQGEPSQCPMVWESKHENHGEKSLDFTMEPIKIWFGVIDWY